MKGDFIIERGVRYVFNDVVKRIVGVNDIYFYKLRYIFVIYLLN